MFLGQALYELAIDPSEIDDGQILDKLGVHINNVICTDTESDERVKTRPKIFENFMSLVSRKKRS